MPATVPACGGSKWRSLLIQGRARDMLVRSINAIVYMIKATGMMRSQRMEIGDGVIFVAAFLPGATIIRITELPRLSSSDSCGPDKNPAGIQLKQCEVDRADVTLPQSRSQCGGRASVVLHRS